MKNQGVIQLGGEVGHSFLSKKIDVSLTADFSSISNPYVFNGNTWVNNTGSFNFYAFSLKSAMEFGVFNLNPTFIYTLSTAGLLPELQAYGRIFIKGKLFKAKKLEALVGVYVSYVSKYNNRYYISSMDTYNYSSVDSYAGMVNLHAFLSLGISEFRFFIRYENIGYFWSDKTTDIVSGYPISPPRLRIGLTWDFFN